MKEILWSVAEDYEDRYGDRAYEFERSIDHGGEDPEEILGLLNAMGY